MKVWQAFQAASDAGFVTGEVFDLSKNDNISTKLDVICDTVHGYICVIPM